MPATTIRVVWGATVCESHILQARVKALPPLVSSLWVEAGYADAAWIADWAAWGIQALAPLAKPVGKATPQNRRDRAAYRASPQGQARDKQPRSSLEPFFATLQDFFHLDPVPLPGQTNAAAFILLAL